MRRDVLLVKGASRACRPPLVPFNLQLSLCSTKCSLFSFNLSIPKCLSASCCCFQGGGATDSTWRSSPPTSSLLLLLANKQQEPEREAESLPSPGQEGRLEAEQSPGGSKHLPTLPPSTHPPAPPRLLCNQLTEAGNAEQNQSCFLPSCGE